MSRPLILSASALLLILAGCEKSSDQESGKELANGTATVAKTFEGPRPEGVSTGNEAVTTTYYIPAASVSDLYEIESSKLALSRSRSAQVKGFANQMIADHGKTTAALKSFVADNPVNIAPAINLDPRREAMMKNLRDTSDTEFDGEYAGQQAAAHQEALNLHQSYARRGDYPKLKALAAQTAQLVARHAQMVSALESAVGGAPRSATGAGGGDHP